jgi:rod shape-determining protein MreC
MRQGSEALLAFLVLTCLTLLLTDLQTGGSAFSGARTLVAGVVGPLQIGTQQSLGAAPANARLSAENQRLQAELRASAGDRLRLRQLEALLGVASSSGQTVVAASVVGESPSPGPSATITIDRGAQDGIVADQAVLADGGLAGVVLRTAQTTSVVRLASDPAFVVGAVLTASGESGIVRGTSDPDWLSLELLDPLVTVRIGEAVATMGSGVQGPFPPGVAIGNVSGKGDASQTRRVLRIRPAADLTRLSVVGVLIPVATSPAATSVPPTPGSTP